LNRQPLFDRYDRPPELEGPRPGLVALMQSAVAKVVAVAIGVLVLAGAVAVSIVVFAVILAVLLGFGIYAWWKIRQFRKHLEAQREQAPRWHDNVIEGEVIRRSQARDHEPR
jgi:uncharacterized protein HemX